MIMRDCLAAIIGVSSFNAHAHEPAGVGVGVRAPWLFNASHRRAAGPPGVLTEPDCASARRRSEEDQEGAPRGRASTRIPWTFHYPPTVGDRRSSTDLATPRSVFFFESLAQFGQDILVIYDTLTRRDVWVGRLYSANERYIGEGFDRSFDLIGIFLRWMKFVKSHDEVTQNL